MAGSVIGNLVILPAIATFGDRVPTPIAPATQPVAQLDLSGIQANYLRFIGGGVRNGRGHHQYVSDYAADSAFVSIELRKSQAPSRPRRKRSSYRARPLDED